MGEIIEFARKHVHYLNLGETYKVGPREIRRKKIDKAGLKL